MQVKKFIIPALSLFLTSSPLFADICCCSNFWKFECWRPVAAIGGGKAYLYNSGQSNNFPAQNGILSFYDYPTPKINTTKSYFTAMLGAEVQACDELFYQIGIGYFRPERLYVHGTVIQGVSLDSADRFHYQYQIQTYAAFLQNKVFKRTHYLYPYLEIGIGAAWNHVNAYNVEPAFSSISPVFGSNTTTSFAYFVGAGIDVPVYCDNFRVGFGYRFMSFGAADTDNAVIGKVITHYSLSQSNLYANEFFGQLTVKFL